MKLEKMDIAAGVWRFDESVKKCKQKNIKNIKKFIKGV